MWEYTRQSGGPKKHMKWIWQVKGDFKRFHGYNKSNWVTSEIIHFLKVQRGCVCVEPQEMGELLNEYL